MRSVFLVLVGLALFSLAAPVQAQDRFVTACSATDAELPPGQDVATVCACAASAALAQGATGASLDATLDFASPVDPNAPAEVRKAGSLIVAGMVGCMTADPARTAEGGRSTAGTAEVVGTPGVSSPATVAVLPAALPPGLRTGNGTDPVQTTSAGAGSAIRIVR